MATNKKNVDERNASKSTLEAEGIIVENINPMQEDLEKEIGALQTKEAAQELFDAIGVEAPKTITEPEKPRSYRLKEELNKGGIELLPTEPLEDEEL